MKRSIISCEDVYLSTQLMFKDTSNNITDFGWNIYNTRITGYLQQTFPEL